MRLVKLEPQYRRHLNEMLEEWLSVESPADITPWAIVRWDHRDFDGYLEHLEIREETDSQVPDSTFFCLDEEKDIFVGAVNIRHYLNQRLLMCSGHIGDGVRPSLRGRGIGTKMVGLALEECRKLGITRVLMVCDSDNPASARTIIRNGGVMENEIEVDGFPIQRYWIDLGDKT